MIHIFSHIEKTGGTTIIRLLRSYLGWRHIDLIPDKNHSDMATDVDLSKALRLNPFACSISGHSIREHALENRSDSIKWSAVVRDPSDRYISDFHHYVWRFNFPDDFGLWLDYQPRHNFQTRSLLGDSEAMSVDHLFSSSNIKIGTLPNLADFATHLLQERGVAVRVRNEDLNVEMQSQRPAESKVALVAEFGERIEAANKQDKNLFEKAKSEESYNFSDNVANATLTSITRSARTWQNRLWRAVIYKPMVGESPFTTHVHRSYREAQSWSEADWRQAVKNSGKCSDLRQV